jgi:hypothetical protein
MLDVLVLVQGLGVITTDATFSKEIRMAVEAGHLDSIALLDRRLSRLSEGEGIESVNLLVICASGPRYGPSALCQALRIAILDPWRWRW